MVESISAKISSQQFVIPCELCGDTGEVMHFSYGKFHARCFETFTYYLSIVNYKANHITFEHIDYPFLTSLTTLRQLYEYDMTRNVKK